MIDENKKSPEIEKEDLLEEVKIGSGEQSKEGEGEEVQTNKEDQGVKEEEVEVEAEVINSIDEELASARKLAEENMDKYKRTFAEFDNYRKRTEKEKTQMYSLGAKNALEPMLRTIDDFERAFEHIEDKDDTLYKGMELIYRNMLKSLKQLGVTEIEALGKEFDPELHNAVSHEENDDYGDNEVIEVFQKGYKYKDQILRHSMVKVAN